MKRKGRKDMKGRCLAMGLAMLALCIPAYATTVDETDFNGGVGVDTVVYRGSSPYLEKVTIESKYDFENKEATVFAVATVDLFSALVGA